MMGVYGSGRPMKFHPTSSLGHLPPEKPGEYRICDERGDILYIGETNNLNRRMAEHIRSGRLQSSCSFEYKVADGRSTSVTRREHERIKIAQHSPVLNRSGGGEGRIASRKR